MEVTIREANEDDLASMYDVSIQAHQRAYGELIPKEGIKRFTLHYTPTAQGKECYVRKMGERLKDPHWQLWVAEKDGRLVGYTLRQWADQHLLRLRGLFVHPDYFGQGIGRSLFEKSLESANGYARITLTVLKHNKRAKSLYAQYGFQVVEDGGKFYGAPQDRMEVASLTFIH